MVWQLKKGLHWNKKNIIIYIQRAETQLKQAVSPQKENSTFVKNVQLDD